MTTPAVRPLDRYRSIIADWEEFERFCARPLPVDARVNALRVSPDALRDRLAPHGVTIESATWDPCAIRASRPIGRTLEHWLGLFYLQERVQSAPVLALDPQPGERVLDLCAAPGGKTVDIAIRMQNTGCVVANEPNGRRQQSLLTNVNRIGIWNVTASEYYGQDFPAAVTFDRVLVDAPCTAEGTLRKQASLRTGATAPAVARLARLQRQLIVRGFDRLRAGGVLVYSTCTFAPEENEAVVSHLLQSREAQVVPFDPPFPHASGLLEWEEARYEEGTQRCVRIYPQHLDSGGGFVARIERRA
jgi:NOL1/NOP2/sun family putative RNA methylase